MGGWEVKELKKKVRETCMCVITYLQKEYPNAVASQRKKSKLVRMKE